MKVEFLDGTCTRARLTRGWLWWRRVAYVRALPEHFGNTGCPRPLCRDSAHPTWVYELTGRDLEGDRNHHVRVAQIRALDACMAIAAPGLDEWRRPDELPNARTLAQTRLLNKGTP